VSAVPTEYQPTADEIKWHGDIVAEIRKRQLSGSENFDKSILTLSSAGLGLSVGFLKDVNLDAAVLGWALYTSWAMFTAATASTMLSFLVSGKALEWQETLATRAYLKGDDKAYDEENRWDKVTRGLNACSAAAFIAALVLTTVFISANLNRGTPMTKNQGPDPVQKGAPVPPIQRLPVRPQPAPPAQGGPTQSPSSGSGPQK
jgi:hypothetical protein